MPQRMMSAYDTVPPISTSGIFPQLAAGNGVMCRLTPGPIADVSKSYIDRMATIGWTDAARRAWLRLARTATSTASVAPKT